MDFSGLVRSLVVTLNLGVSLRGRGQLIAPFLPRHMPAARWRAAAAYAGELPVVHAGLRDGAHVPAAFNAWCTACAGGEQKSQWGTVAFARANLGRQMQAPHRG